MHRISLTQLKELVVSRSGASCVGVAQIAPVADEAIAIYEQWLADGCHADMAYLEKYADVRANPALLLEGARSLIIAAFSFANPDTMRLLREKGVPLVAEYALGQDYHDEIKRRLHAAASCLTEKWGGKTRVCVDTAPLRERYWARKAGLGFIGTNNYLIIPGKGMHFVLGTILWTGETEDGIDEPLPGDCGHCGRCVDSCPARALSPDGRLDARRCLSYLTIEDRKDTTPDIPAGIRLFGCDTCRRVCPHEPLNPETTAIEAFQPDVRSIGLTAEEWLGMTPERFADLFGKSALRRAGLSKLQSTLKAIKRP